MFGAHRTAWIVAGYLLYLVVGYAASELAWRRGVRLTRKICAI